MTKKLLLIVLLICAVRVIAQKDTSILEIKKNYDRINAIQKWSKTKNINNYNAYDGGTDNKVTLFYSSTSLEKISVILYREMSKKETQYYFFNNELSCVIDKLTLYKEPLQSKNSKILTDKLYFKNKKLVSLKMQQDSGLDMPSDTEVYELFEEEVVKIKKASELN